MGVRSILLPLAIMSFTGLDVVTAASLLDTNQGKDMHMNILSLVKETPSIHLAIQDQGR